MWIGTDDKGCCDDPIQSAIWIGNNVTGRFHNKLEVPCGFEQMIEDDVMTYIEVISEMDRCERMLS
jgi:hypothetical protein